MSLLWGENIISGLPFGLGRGTIEKSKDGVSIISSSPKEAQQ